MTYSVFELTHPFDKSKNFLLLPKRIFQTKNDNVIFRLKNIFGLANANQNTLFVGLEQCYICGVEGIRIYIMSNN